MQHYHNTEETQESIYLLNLQLGMGEFLSVMACVKTKISCHPTSA